MGNTKNTWFYLEPYIVTEIKDDELLTLNTLEGSFLVFKMSLILESLILELLKKDNNYCTMLDHRHLKDEKTILFLSKIRNEYYGDFIEVELTSSKPFIPFPIRNYQRDNGRLSLESSFHGKDILLNLSELTIFLNSGCSNKCTLCNMYFKQTLFCTNCFNKDLPMTLINRFLCQIPLGSKIGRINITGSNVIQYDSLYSLCDALIAKGIYTVYYVHYLNIDYLNNETFEKLKMMNNIIILVSHPLDINKIKGINKLLIDAGIHYIYKVVIENERQYMQIQENFTFVDIDDVEIVPIYNNHNMSFLKKHLFTRKKDLYQKKVSKKQYYMNQTFNINYYGKILIASNGDFYTNFNQLPLGNIKSESIYDIIYSEMYKGKSWGLIRDSFPCNKCVFQYLCPPISNYELVIGKINLCHLRQ